MKVKGKIGQFQKMLRKMGVDGHFDPITMKVENDKISVKGIDMGNTARCRVEFYDFDIDLEGEESFYFEVNTKEMLDVLSPCPTDVDATMTMEGNSKLRFTVPNETFEYSLLSTSDEGYTEEEWYDLSEDGLTVYGKQETDMDTGIKISSKEWRAINTRVDMVDEIEGVKFVATDDDKVMVRIGDLGADNINSREYELDVIEWINEGKTETKIALLIDEISKTVSGDIKVFWKDWFPLFVVDEDEGYQAVYFVSPREPNE